MMFPTIHINGSSPKDLFENACEALGALRNAISAVEAQATSRRPVVRHGAAMATAADWTMREEARMP